VSIADLRNGMRDVSITLQVESWVQRSFESQNGESKTVRSGDVMDPSGRCRLTAWCEFDPSPGETIMIEGGRVQFWQGSPDLVIDDMNQVKVLSESPWDAIDPQNHWVEVDLTSLTQGGSRRGISTSGSIVMIRPDSGMIERCPECRRVIRDGSCSEHGSKIGEEDLRLRFVLDDGISNASLILGRETSEAFLGMGMDDVKSEISNIGREVFVSNLKNRILARKMGVHGRCLVDGQGAMLMAERVEILVPGPKEEAEEVMKRWEVEI